MIIFVIWWIYHRMVWVGGDLKDHLGPIPLPWAGTPSTRPECSKPHLALPWKSTLVYYFLHRTFRGLINIHFWI